MTEFVFPNNAITETTQTISSGDTTIHVEDASVFPSLGANEVIRAAILGEDEYELVDITGVDESNNELTVERGKENTSAQDFTEDGLTITATISQDVLATFAQSDDLATVATTGDYGDLNNTPDLATVATTGEYDDLSGTPDLSVLEPDFIDGPFTLRNENDAETARITPGTGRDGPSIISAGNFRIVYDADPNDWENTGKTVYETTEGLNDVTTQFNTDGYKFLNPDDGGSTLFRIDNEVSASNTQVMVTSFVHQTLINSDEFKFNNDPVATVTVSDQFPTDDPPHDGALWIVK